MPRKVAPEPLTLGSGLERGPLLEPADDTLSSLSSPRTPRSPFSLAHHFHHKRDRPNDCDLTSSSTSPKLVRQHQPLQQVSLPSPSLSIHSQTTPSLSQSHAQVHVRSNTDSISSPPVNSPLPSRRDQPTDHTTDDIQLPLHQQPHQQPALFKQSRYPISILSTLAGHDTITNPLLIPTPASTPLTSPDWPDHSPLAAPGSDDLRPSRSGFFFFGKSSNKSSQQLGQSTCVMVTPPSTSPSHFDPVLGEKSMSRGTETPLSQHTDPSYPGQTYAKQPVHPSRSDLSLASSGEYGEASQSSIVHLNPSQAGSTARKPKPKTFSILNRTRPGRDSGIVSPMDTSPRVLKAIEPETPECPPLKPGNVGYYERQLRDYTAPGRRTQSAERSGDPAVNKDLNGNKEQIKSQHVQHQFSTSGRENSAFFSNLIKNSSTKAADMITKSLFGKSGWSGGWDKEAGMDDEHYQLKIINLPLVQQTRITRISKRLEESKDKTEFWMPAFPWRAIDYLNYKGCDVEGLYRVPGSGQQVKRWQRRFDEEHDIDLFAQQCLYDINIVGSMLKAWLRELPDELLPKSVQDRVSRECVGAEKVPQMLVDELSNLSPFNYYLLFAITCHLSLLLAHSDKNKMDFRNLCICFQPCMKIDAFSFKFLVCDWRDCWKGCKNELKYIEEEYVLFNQPPPRGMPDSRRSGHSDQQEKGTTSPLEAIRVTDAVEEEAVDTAKSRARKQRPTEGPTLTNCDVKAAVPTISIDTLAITNDGGETQTPRPSCELRPLSPIKPLSPLNF